MTDPLLEIRDLSVRFETPEGPVQAVDRLCLTVGPGECLGVVGESGSGKSQTFLALFGLLADNARATGVARFAGEQLLNAPQARLNALRGNEMAMIFQDSLTGLTPHMQVGWQLAEVPREHRSLSRKAAASQALQAMQSARIPEAERRFRMFPHEYSGGMRQRAMIAQALLCQPRLLVADEPTTALDVTVQASILELFRQFKERANMALVLITHDLGVVAGLADRVAVLHQGRLMEANETDALFRAPRHPYTRNLLASVPKLDLANGKSLPPLAKPPPEPLLAVQDLSVCYQVRAGGPFGLNKRPLRALNGLDLQIAPGETLAVVGESGCGKSTLGRAILGFAAVERGAIRWGDANIARLTARQMKPLRRHIQAIFQSPLASLNPRMTAGEIVMEPLEVFEPALSAAERSARMTEALRQVGLALEMAGRYPNEFSGGECQRIAIARAIVLRPKLLICDEAVSALDASIKGQILDLLKTLQRQTGVALLFISHDLAVVRQISHRVMVMYLGKVVETAPASRLFRAPLHPYTKALLAAVPRPDPAQERIRKPSALGDDLPSPLFPPSGCVFRTRCPLAQPKCAQQVPPSTDRGNGHQVACHYA